MSVTDRSDAVRIAAVSGAPEWMMRLVELLAPVGGQAFRSLESAVSEATGTEGVVAVLGPPETVNALSTGARFDDPRVAVVGVVEDLDVDALRSAMQVGFADLVGPADLDRLPTIAKGLGAKLGSSPTRATSGAAVPGRLVLVTSARAGQGTTGVAANLGVVLARSGPTILAEGDPRFGELLDAFGARDTAPPRERSGLAGSHWAGDYLFRDPSGVHLLALPEDAGRALDPDGLLELVSALQRTCAALVVDVPLWVLERYHLHRVADDVVLVTADSRRDLRRITPAVEALGLGPGHGHLVVRRRTGEISPSRLSDEADVPVLAVLPEDDAANRAEAAGRPVVEVAPDSELARALEQASSALLARWRAS